MKSTAYTPDQEGWEWAQVYGPKRDEDDKEKTFTLFLEGRCTFCNSRAYVGIYSLECPNGCGSEEITDPKGCGT